MKKHDVPPSHRHFTKSDSANLSSGTAAALHTILKNAYHRHARGRLARAAVTACLGR